MTIKRFEIWIMDLEPGNESEPGKIRPVVVVQNNVLNEMNHSSFVICPISSQKRTTKGKLRVFVKFDDKNGLTKDSYILSDHLRSVDVNRFKEKIGTLDLETSIKLMDGIKIVLAL
jgi:mRNA interferase MazF